MNDIRHWVKDSRIDIVALGAEGKPVLLVEVKGIHGLPNPKRKEILLTLNDIARKFAIPYIMFVDLDKIDIYTFNENPDAKWDDVPLLELPTDKILSEYDPKFGQKSKPIFTHYLEILTEGWLRDVAYNWKSGSPPCTAKLQEIGLAQKLSNGTTYSESSMSR